jgi:hypothetical protein
MELTTVPVFLIMAMESLEGRQVKGERLKSLFLDPSALLVKGLTCCTVGTLPGEPAMIYRM